MTEQLTAEHTEVEKRSPVPVRVAWASVPRVNLLPIEILEGRRFHRTQAVLGSAILITALVAAGITFWAQQGVNDANKSLHTSQAKVSALQAEQAKYAMVPKVIAEVNAANTAQTLAMGGDILWYRYLNDLDGIRPTGLELTGITVTPATAASSAPSSNPLVPTGLGTITITGTATRYDEVSTWLEQLTKVAGFSAATLTSAAQTDGTLTFTSGAVVDLGALSGRYK